MTQPWSRFERKLQKRVAHLFTAPVTDGGLGYEDLSNWSKRENNCAIEVDLLRANLTVRGYTPAHISAALQTLEVAVDVTGITPYQDNLCSYPLLRYGVQVQITAGQSHETVQLIDWAQPERNHFVLAEEVTLKGGHIRRPDIVFYINGLAMAVIELKCSSVDVGDGIRQLGKLQTTRCQPCSTSRPACCAPQNPMAPTGRSSFCRRTSVTGCPHAARSVWKGIWRAAPSGRRSNPMARAATG